MGVGGLLTPLYPVRHMCCPKKYHFQAFLVWNRVQILPFGSEIGYSILSVLSGV